LYACRAEAAGEVSVLGVKNTVDVAVMPNSDASRVLGMMNAAFPQFQLAPSILHTTLNNLNAMAHPAPTLLNAGRIESGLPFEYYHGGITSSIARVVEALDAERQAIGKALDVDLPSIREWLGRSYGLTGDRLHEVFASNPAYAGIMGPPTLETRYLFEDVPTGLVPLALLGDALGVPTPKMRAVVEIANAATGRDHWREGRTLERLGLADMSADQVRTTLCAWAAA
jgi:opine dehydrogenase